VILHRVRDVADLVIKSNLSWDMDVPLEVITRRVYEILNLITLAKLLW